MKAKALGYVRSIGSIKLEDGREIKGVIVEFPDGPPDLTFNVLFDEIPVTIEIAKLEPENV